MSCMVSALQSHHKLQGIQPAEQLHTMSVGSIISCFCTAADTTSEPDLEQCSDHPVQPAAPASTARSMVQMLSTSCP